MSKNLDPQKLPTHIAIIPDGNRRWARMNRLPDLEGHRKGLEAVVQLAKDARKLGIKYMTFWFFSTDNWKRAKIEVDYLMNLAIEKFDEIAKDLLKEEVHFTHLGRKDRIPEKLTEKFRDLEEKTKDFTKYYLNLAFDYGGRDEIMTAVKRMIKDKVDPEKITEELFGEYLYTKGIPDIDLMIRTSGEMRTSGYLPWQGIYAEFAFPTVHCPDFNIEELKKVLIDYQNRDRRFGGNSKKEDSKYKRVG